MLLAAKNTNLKKPLSQAAPDNHTSPPSEGAADGANILHLTSL